MLVFALGLNLREWTFVLLLTLFSFLVTGSCIERVQLFLYMVLYCFGALPSVCWLRSGVLDFCIEMWPVRFWQ